MQLPAVAASVYATLLLSIVTVKAQDARGHYTIVGSKHIRPHSDYHVAVNLHDATVANSMRLTLQNDANWRLVKEIVVQPHSSESLVFELPDLPLNTAAGAPIEYKLIAEGTEGIRFRNETDLQVNSKQFSVLMQTDKAMYKPGDLVRFRILVLDANTKPMDVNGGLQVHIVDGQTNRIKQWTNATASRGVFSGELQLSDFPVLGKWQLIAELQGVTKKKQIEVAEYVLPKFEVLIETEKDVVFTDAKISANIRGKYTYGKPVRGEATVTLQPKIHGAYQPFIADLISRKVVKVVTKGSVEFDIKDDLKLGEEYERELQMDVIFEEELTGRKQTAQSLITIRRSQYKIAVVNPLVPFKVGEAYQFEIQVSRHDGRPVQDTTSPLELMYGPYLTEETFRETRTLDKHGRVKVSWMINEQLNSLNVRAKFMGVTESLGFAPRYTSDGPIHGLQTRVLTERPTLGKPITIEVQSETPFSSYTYQIFGRGDIIKTETVNVPNVTRHEIKFLASFAMVPSVKIIVYHIADGKMHSDTKTIELRDQLQNTITLSSSTLETAPGKNVDLKITTRPNSYVGLLGVDQSVLLLKSGNDLSQSEVFDELDEYTKEFNAGRRRKRFSPYPYPRFPGQSSAGFENIGAFLMSNLYEPIPEYEYAFNIDYQEEQVEEEEEELFDDIDAERESPPSPNSPIIRKDFPESWIWDFFQIDSSRPDGIQTLNKKVPDTITSWVITAFSLDPVTGIALTQEPTKLKVFQPFFVSLNLPYSIKRGEVVSIPIVVFNYMSNAVNAEVTLHNEDQDFDFVDISNEIEETPKIELYRRKRLDVKSNDGATTTFMIKPKKVGPLTIKVTATSPLAGDGVERILPVEPEGAPMYTNTAIFVDLRQTAEMHTNFSVEIPRNAVPDSTRIEVSLIGDILGSSIKNLDSLIRMPYGCGEQNMLNFVPNIVVLNYLKSINQLTPAVEAKTKKYMEIGYQRELTYRHKDGSFSAFGESDSSGSTWLTAFVAKSFRQAAEHVDVEERIIDEALKFLAANQAENGSFPEVGTVVHADMQGGSGQGIALTAYTLTAFLENKNAIPTYRNAINKAMEYIVRNLESLDDVYAQALAAYALQLAEHNAKDFVLLKLNEKATVKDGQMYWTKPVPESESRSIWYNKPNSVNTEMTAYGLLAHVEAGPFTEAVPIMKWLLAQRNAAGGFESTQDTIIGLQALAKMAEKFASTDTNMRLSVKYGAGLARDITLNTGNKLVLQQFPLPATIRQMNVTATGHGIGLFSLAYKYNVNVTGAWPRFTVDPQVNRNSNPDYLHLTVCTSFIANDEAKQSNMAVMEVEFPSGFTADLDTIPSLEATENVKKVETKNGDTVMVIYFENLGTKELCPTVDAFRTHKVAMQKPAPVTVYDYYDTTRKARMFYKIAETGLCDICEEECPESCSARTAEQRADGPIPSMDGMVGGSGRIGAGVGALVLVAVAALF